MQREKSGAINTVSPTACWKGDKVSSYSHFLVEAMLVALIRMKLPCSQNCKPLLFHSRFYSGAVPVNFFLTHQGALSQVAKNETALNLGAKKKVEGCFLLELQGFDGEQLQFG